MSVVELKVPTIGESITEVTLSKWLVADGEYVNIDNPICEFESDKATLEFPAEVAGKLIWVAEEGADLEIGALVAKIDTSVTANNSEPTPTPTPEATPPPPATNTTSAGKVIEMKVPTIGESITEVTLAKWLIENGAYVKLDEPICEFESDKATLEFPAEAAGKLLWVAEEGDDLEIGALVAKIDTSVAASNGTAKATPTIAATTASTTTSAGNGHPSPAAAKILREGNVAASTVTGTGKDGRITKADAQAAVTNKVATPPTAPTPPKQASTAEPAVAPSNGFSRAVRREKMSRMRRTISRRLLSATQNTAMLTTFNEVDLSAVMALRKKYQEQFVEKNGVKLGFMSLFAKACAKALMEMPQVNSHIDGDHLIYHDYVDISFAISTDRGLVVPPIKNIESLKFHEIELKLKELASKARNNKLTLAEMTGGTFAITNGGIFGSMMSTPILNEPQSAILGMHNIIQRPIAVNGEVVIRPMMYLALSYDHRVIDGKSSVTFLVKVKNYLEDPTTLLLDL